MNFGALEMQRIWRGVRTRLLLRAGRSLAISVRMPLRGALRRLELRGIEHEQVALDVAREVEARERPTPAPLPPHSSPHRQLPDAAFPFSAECVLLHLDTDTSCTHLIRHR